MQCPICLSDFKDKALVGGCFHEFCFDCICYWKNQSDLCPMCKREFQFVVHDLDDIRSKFVFRTGVRRDYGSATSSEYNGIQQRRRIYFLGLCSIIRKSGDGKFRSLSPDYMKKNVAKVEQYLKPWIDRDLLILVGEDNVELISSYILSMIQTIGIMSEEFRKSVESILGSKTDHFIHEMIAFASSPWNMTTFDQCSEFEDAIK